MSDERVRSTERVVAVADCYVLTNRIRDLLEDRLEAVNRAVLNGATDMELCQALRGADASGSELDQRVIAECQAIIDEAQAEPGASRA